MRPGLKKSTWSVALAVTAVLAAAKRADANIIVTAEVAGIQASQVAGVTTMDFNSVLVGSYTLLSSPIGTYTAPSPGLAVVAPNQFGGSDQTRYVSVGAQSGQTQAVLTFDSPAAYFGFYWSAGDPGNVLRFFRGGSLLGSFNVGSIIPLLKPEHFGNPNTGQDGGEPFVYLNFIGTNGIVFDQVIFANTSTSSGFESDNHSFRAAPLQTPLPGTEVGTIPVAVPEPASIISIFLGTVSVSALRLRHRTPSCG